MNRPKVPKSTECKVLDKCRRRCAFCFHFDFDTSMKKGQISHIDRNPNNNKESNLIFLCLNHHEEYDTSPRQTKGLTPDEAKKAKSNIETIIERKLLIFFPEPQGDVQSDKTLVNKEGISVEVYKLRYPIFDAFMKFVLSILQDAKGDLKSFYEFRANTNDALFLFNDEIDRLIRDVDKNALKLIYCQRKMENPDRFDQDDWLQLVDKENELLNWFEDVFTIGRESFYPFLKIKDRIGSMADSLISQQN